MTNQPTTATPRPMSLIEVATMLHTPASAVCAALIERHGEPSPLLAVGFPRPHDLLHGRPTWRRDEVETFAADRARLSAATGAARQGLIGHPVAVAGAATQVRGEG